MKEADAKVDHPHQMLLYVEKPDGSYGTVQTGSYMASNFLDDFQEKQRYFHETNSQAVLAGEISMVAYYMNMQELTLPEVADRVGLSKGAVRRHMDPAHFGELTVAQARRYAELFGVPLAKLFAFFGAGPADPAARLDFRPGANPDACVATLPAARPQ